MINILIFVAFIIAIAVILLIDRKNIKREGIILIRRTQKGVNFIDKVANKFPRFWNVFSIIGVIVAVGAMFFASYFIIMSAVNVAAGGAEGVKLVLPGPVDNAVAGPAVLLMPWYFWVIGIFSLIIPHEFSHGIMSRLRKVKVKTVGWILLILLPGAFVEPDEKQLKKASAGTKLRIYAAGSFANFVVALVIFSFMFFIFVPGTLNVVGLTPRYLEADLPMAVANATGTILTIDGVQMLNQEILSEKMASIPVGSEINVETSTGNYSIVTVAHELRDGSRIGVIGPYYEQREIKHEFADTIMEPIIFFFGQLLDWVVLLNLGVGLVNLLPLKPLDGGLIMETIIEKLNGKKSLMTSRIVKLISVAFLFLLIYSVFGGLI